MANQIDSRKSLPCPVGQRMPRVRFSCSRAVASNPVAYDEAWREVLRRRTAAAWRKAEEADVRVAVIESMLEGAKARERRALAAMLDGGDDYIPNNNNEEFVAARKRRELFEWQLEAAKDMATKASTKAVRCQMAEVNFDHEVAVRDQDIKQEPESSSDSDHE